jgi:hypothetical protein
LPFDSETAQIRNNETNTWRFFVDKKLPIPTPYELEGDSETTEFNYGDHGLIEMVVKQGVLQPNDNPELVICAYKIPTPTPPVGTTYSKIVTDGELYLNYERILTATSFNSDNTVNSGVNLVWTWTLPSGFEDGYFTITPSGNTCKVKVIDSSYSVLGENVTINVVDSNGEYKGTIIITVNAM